MRLAVLGAGNVGQALARAGQKAGHAGHGWSWRSGWKLVGPRD